jgi:HEAT repeat protein
MTPRPAILLLVASLMALPPVRGDASDRDRLTRAGLPTDSPGIVALFRRLTPKAGDGEQIAALTARLADPSYNARRAAVRDLTAFGPKAIPALKAAADGPDAEAAQRARDCLTAISRDFDPAALAVAARVLAADPADGALDALLDFLPVADPMVVPEMRRSVERLARDPRSAAAVRAALKRPEPAVREAAAVAAVRAGSDDLIAAARPLTADVDPRVRVGVALALAERGDAAALAAAIDVLETAPAALLAPVDALLLRAAGEDAPDVEYGSTAAQRKEYQTAWRQWLAERAADPAVAQRLRAGPDRDRFWVNLTTPRVGAVLAEATFGGKAENRVLGLDYPMAYQTLPRGQFLFAEFRQGRVIQRDAAGRITWERAVTHPIAVQKLPAGRRFVGHRSGFAVYDADGAEIMSKALVNAVGISRRRDGSVVVMQSNGTCQTFHADGKTAGSFTVGTFMPSCQIDALPDGRVLVPEFSANRVSEFDATGRRIWIAPINRPSCAFRTADGRTLVSSQSDGVVYELDHAGTVTREWRPGDGERPWMVYQP